MRFHTAHMLLLSSPLLLLGCVVAQDDPWFICPRPETITPCVCEKACPSGCPAEFHCSNFTTQDQFEEVIKKSDYPFRAALIQNSVLQYIPHEFFEEKQFRQLDVVNCTFMSLLDRKMEKDTPLKELTLNNVVLISGLRYDVFSSMNSLVKLYFAYMEVQKIPTNLCSFMPPKLEILYFDTTKTAKIGDLAFADCRALRILFVKNGIIKTVKSSMFPKNLESLVLSGNKIKSLPNDFAVDMPKLKEIYIDQNKFSFLDENIFVKIPGLKYLIVHGNPLFCDCKLKWILSHKRISIEGRCPNLDGRRINSLTENDFKIC